MRDKCSKKEKLKKKIESEIESQRAGYKIIKKSPDNEEIQSKIVDCGGQPHEELKKAQELLESSKSIEFYFGSVLSTIIHNCYGGDYDGDDEETLAKRIEEHYQNNKTKKAIKDTKTEIEDICNSALAVYLANSLNYFSLNESCGCIGCEKVIKDDIILYGFYNNELIFSHDNMIPDVEKGCPIPDVNWHAMRKKDFSQLLQKASLYIEGKDFIEIFGEKLQKTSTNLAEYEEQQNLISAVTEFKNKIYTPNMI
jgi:hypothetical protein